MGLAEWDVKVTNVCVGAVRALVAESAAGKVEVAQPPFFTKSVQPLRGCSRMKCREKCRVVPTRKADLTHRRATSAPGCPASRGAGGQMGTGWDPGVMSNWTYFHGLIELT